MIVTGAVNGVFLLGNWRIGRRASSAVCGASAGDANPHKRLSRNVVTDRGLFCYRSRGLHPGSSLVNRLLANGETVVGYDNLSTGLMRFLDDDAGIRNSASFRATCSYGDAHRRDEGRNIRLPSCWPTPMCGSEPSIPSATCSRTRSRRSTLRSDACEWREAVAFSSTGSIYSD